MASTLPTFAVLIAPAEAIDLERDLQGLVDRFKKLGRRIRKRSIDLEDAVTHSSDVSVRRSTDISIWYREPSLLYTSSNGSGSVDEYVNVF